MKDINLNDLTLSQAVDAFNRNDIDTAQNLFLKVLNVDEKNPDALYFMGMIDHGASRYEVAEYRAEELVKQKPTDGKALNLLGTILMTQRKLEAALEHFEKGIKHNTDDVMLKVNAAICNIGLANPSRSIELCKDAINLNKEYVNAWNILGNAYMGKSDMENAVVAFEKALEMKPDFMDAKFNLGVSLFELKRYEQAESNFDAILETSPEHVHALCRKADIHMIRDEYHQAGELYQRATEIHSDFVPALVGRGRVFDGIDKYNEALSNFKRALELDPNSIQTLMYIGMTFIKMDDDKAAAAAFNDILTIDPDNAQAKFHLAAVSGNDTPMKPESHYIKNLFDEFANTYDKKLSDIEYNAPEQLAELVKSLTDNDQMDIVDLGCGTGLCGLQFKDISSHMIGVDLSPKMLQATSKRGVYDKLEEKDILESLVHYQNRFDLVLSADTFPYLGDLDSVFVSITSAMKPGSIVAFTTERLDGEEDFKLERTTRYTHSEKYIRSIADRRNLEVMHCEPTVIRKERGEDVPGLIVAMRKSA